VGTRKTSIVATIYGDDTLKKKLVAIAEKKKKTMTQVLRDYIEEEYYNIATQNKP